MGNIWAALCCCFKRKPKKLRTVRDKGFVSHIKTRDYKIPNNRYSEVDDVFRDKGYDYKSKLELGKGGFSIVYKMNRISDKQIFALKVIRLKGNDKQRDPKKFQNLMNEIYVVSTIRHKNIIQLFDHFIINNISYLIMEFANIGDVEEEIKRLGPMTESKAKTYFIQIAKAIQYLHLHDPPIAHMDLKLANILIHIQNNEKILKVTDFGFTRILSETTDKKPFRAKDAMGTLEYMSPQNVLIIAFNDADETEKQLLKENNLKAKNVNVIKADIWSLGVCLHFMVSKEYPFPVIYESYVIRVIKMMKEKRLEIQASHQLNRLLNKMLSPLTRQRITIDRILAHKWLKGVPDSIKLN